MTQLIIYEIDIVGRIVNIDHRKFDISLTTEEYYSLITCIYTDTDTLHKMIVWGLIKRL